MSYLYMFLNGKILLKNGSVPDKADASLFGGKFAAFGAVDRQRRDGDMWAELAADAALPEGFEPHERRGLWPTVDEPQFFRIAKAFHYMDWRRTHKFCARCGAPAVFDEKEFAMRCPKCGELFYPWISPAIIVAVERDGRLLMGHGVNFPAGRYSVLAGFVEPGENLEQCVEREVYEESRIRVKNVRYFASQPWAFPHSLMLGFQAEWESGEIVPETSEVSDVRWFAPAEIKNYYRGVSISAKLIEDFIRRHS